MRLINADVLIKQCKPRGIADEVWKESNEYKQIISAPTIDAVEVVRCKDCLMTKERDEYTGKVWCCRHREYMDDMYYCADGLRGEEGEV